MHNYESLVRQAQDGSDIHHDAFNELVKRFQGMAYSYAYAALGDAQLAEDATQNAFIAAYQHLGQLREPEAFPGWLKRIVRTQADRLTRAKQFPMVPIEQNVELAAVMPTPEAALVEQEVIDRIQAAMQALPAHERVVTEGFYFLGESQKEIAERLHLPLTTVKKRLQYARQRLKVLISDLNDTLDLVFQPTLPPQRQLQPVPIRQDLPRELPSDKDW